MVGKMDNYMVVLADLKAQREELIKKINQLDNAIFFIESIKSTLKSTADTLPIFQGDPLEVIPPQAFKGMTTGQAVIKCLRMISKPITTKELIDYLMKGGIKSRALNAKHSMRNSIMSAHENKIFYEKDSRGLWILKDEKKESPNVEG